LHDYFNIIAIPENETISIVNNDDEFVGWAMTPVQTVHIMSGYKIMPSYGIILERNPQILGSKIYKINKLYITSDTQYCPYQIRDFYASADLILEDCETAEFKSHVHAHYEDLKTLEPGFKNKMWLYHYNDQPWGCASFEAMQQMAQHDGFLGFLRQGQVLEI